MNEHGKGEEKKPMQLYVEVEGRGTIEVWGDESSPDYLTTEYPAFEGVIAPERS